LHSSFDSDIERAVISKLTWRLVPFLFLLYIVGYLDRTNVGFAALQMQRQLHFNDAVYGLGAGMFFAGYFCFQLPSNLVLARIGAPRWIALLMVLWGIVSASTVFVTTPRSFYLLRFLLGAAEAGFFPGIIFYFKNWFPASVRARTIAWFMTAGPLSGAIGGPIFWSAARFSSDRPACRMAVALSNGGAAGNPPRDRCFFLFNRQCGDRLMAVA
jgi:MFS family permease